MLFPLNAGGPEAIDGGGAVGGGARTVAIVSLFTDLALLGMPGGGAQGGGARGGATLSDDNSGLGGNCWNCFSKKARIV